MPQDLNTSNNKVQFIANKSSTEIVSNGEAVETLICIFEDCVAEKKRRFHLCLGGDTTVQQVYKDVSQRIKYRNGTFLLAHVPGKDEEAIILDENCEDNLGEILKNYFVKRHDFHILKRDENGPVTVIVDTLNLPKECQDEDIESYAASLFKQQSFTSSGSSVTSDGHAAKASCGFVGLINQAMTCYLNSLLQTLFMTPEFRNALYRWRYKGDDNKDCTSIPFQLQKLFLKLQTSKKQAVETKELTKSFGWDTSEAWQQHDVQELCRVMFDALEETLKDTDQCDLINQLYQGELKDYVKCLKCHHESSRKDKFLDISVEIRPFGSNEPFNNLEEALNAFVTPDTLEGSNQYFCQSCNSKQDAHKGLKFVKFPYLLTIQLKRFTFDINTFQRIKLHDRLEFPLKFSLQSFVKQDDSEYFSFQHSADENSEGAENGNHIFDEKPETNGKQVDDNTYELFSILIHSGSAIGGHYYAYIKLFESNDWYCFNDQYVTQVTLSDIEKAFGGGDKYKSGFYSSSYSSSTSAYMLMYRRVDSVKNVSFKKNLSKSLLQLCQNIKKDEEDEVTEKEREKNMCKIRLFCQHPVKLEFIEHKLFVDKDVSFQETTNIAWKLCELEDVVPIERCRLVKYDHHNESYEKSYEGEEGNTISKALGGAKLIYGFDLLLQCRKEDEQFQVYNPGGTTLKVFIINNLVDNETDEFNNPHILHVPLSFTILELKQEICEIFNLPATIRISVFKKYQDFVLLENPKRTLKMEGFYKSDKIFIQADEEDALKPFHSSLFYNKLESYKNNLNLDIILQLKSVAEEKLTLSVDKRITLEMLKQKIKSQIDIEENLFRVYRMYSNNQEYECTRLDETLSSYPEEVKIIVKDGRALLQGEYRIKLYLLNINNKSDHIQFLMDAVIWKDLSIQKLKEEQILPQLKQQNIYATLTRLRVRRKRYKNPTRIYPDTCVFEKDISISSSNEYFVEILKDDEMVLSDDFLSIYVRQWHSAKAIIDSLEEIILHKSTTVTDMKKKIHEKLGVPSEFIDVAKGQGMFPCNISLLEIETALSWKSNGFKLGEQPFSVLDDGSVFYFRDNREVVKKFNMEERAKILDLERPKTSKVSNLYHQKEKALKIYTDSSLR